MTAPHDPSQPHPQPGIPDGGLGHTEVEAQLAGVEAQVEAGFTERFVAFSDAVVAIAITLLALALPAPGGVSGWTNDQLLHALGRDWAQYLAFLISFLVIGSHAAAHRRIFRYVGSVNRLIGRLNLLWLLMMVLTPPAAVLLSGHGAFGLRFTIYTLIQVIAAACLLLMSLEFRRAGMLRPDAPSRAYHPDSAPLLAICITFLISIPVAFVTGWAYAVWAAIPFVVRILRRRRGPQQGPHPSIHSPS